MPALCVTRTDDGGANWEIMRHGLPQRDAYDLVYRHGLGLSAAARAEPSVLDAARDGAAGHRHQGPALPRRIPCRAGRRDPHRVRDPGLRLVGFRVSRGATLDGAASSFFDGLAWHAGTFNDANGRAQPGIYVLTLEAG